MRSMSGGYGADPDLRTELAKRDNNIDVLKRRLDDMVKVPPPALGGPVGIVDVLSTNGTVAPSGSGTGIDFASVTYDAPVVRAGDGSWLSTSGSDLTVSEAGWYHAVMQVAIGWADADAPDIVQVFTFGGADVAHQDSEWMATVPKGANRGVYSWTDRGPTYLEAGGSFHAEVDFSPATTAAFVPFGGGSARINWTITKLA